VIIEIWMGRDTCMNAWNNKGDCRTLLGKLLKGARLIFQHGREAGIDMILEPVAPGPDSAPEQPVLAPLHEPWLGIVLDSVEGTWRVAYASDFDHMRPPLLLPPAVVVTVVVVVVVVAAAAAAAVVAVVAAESAVEGREDWGS